MVDRDADESTADRDADESTADRDTDESTADRDAEGGNRRDPRAAVRRYDPGDREAVLSLHRRALRGTGTDPEDVPGTDDLRSIRETYVDPGGAFLVAEADGEVVAMGGLRVDDVDGVDDPEGVGELLRMRVDPDHQRRGYGSAILDGLEAAARERGLDRIVLTTARRQRAATEFYPDNGYTEVGREPFEGYVLIRFAKDL